MSSGFAPHFLNFSAKRMNSVTAEHGARCHELRIKGPVRIGVWSTVLTLMPLQFWRPRQKDEATPNDVIVTCRECPKESENAM